MERLSTEIRQEQIKKAVLDIIASEGLHRLSTRNLAERVGISEGALFRHFKSKRDILLGIMQDVRTNLVEPLRQIAVSGAPAEERLFEFLCTHVTYLLQNRGITILLFSEAAHMNDTRLKQHLHEILMEQKQYISKIIQDGIVEGIWDPAIRVENVAMMYMGIPITLNIELVLNPDGVRQENFCKNMIYLLNRAIKKR